jgi:hypothetical protein
MAEWAVSHLNKSFALTSKLHVELAFSKHKPAPASHRPWSKHSKKQASDTADAESGVDASAGSQVTTKVDAKKAEFLAAMGVAPSASATTKSKFWANDDGGIPAPPRTDHSRQQHAITIRE